MLQVCKDQLLRLNADMQKELGTVHGALGHDPPHVPTPDAFTDEMSWTLAWLKADFSEFFEDQSGHGAETLDPAMADDTVMEGVTY
jgi:hypothetical protein